jgi:hypothetical protein
VLRTRRDGQSLPERRSPLRRQRPLTSVTRNTGRFGFTVACLRVRERAPRMAAYTGFDGEPLVAAIRPDSLAARQPGMVPACSPPRHP